MYFLYGVVLMVAGLMLRDMAVGAANARILRHAFLDEAAALTVTSLIGFGALFLFFAMAKHPDTLHWTELGVSFAAILMSIRGVRRAVLRLFRRKAPEGAAGAH